jgi:cellulose biosynthesis protein BcsQ
MKTIRKTTKMQRTRLLRFDRERFAKGLVLAVMNNKGGCGKTSLAIAVAIYLVRAGFNVALIDCDPQCNMSQRLGVSDDMFPKRRLDTFFNLMDQKDFLEKQMQLPITIHFKYLYKLQGFEGKQGTLALLPGSQIAEDITVVTSKVLSGSSVLDFEQKQIGTRFKTAVREYLNYFDFVILDTAPALQGSNLCQYALQSSDEIICPVDGLEAALGLQNVIDWLNVRSSPSYGIIDKPNLTFALTKYHKDDLDDLVAMAAGYPIKNAVFSVLKDVMGQSVCDNGIIEDKSKKNIVYQVYGRINDYEELCNEITTKISKPRPNFFEEWNNNSANRLRAKLREIERITLKKKTPVFKDIIYSENTEEHSESDNVNIGIGHGENLGINA